MSLHEKLKVNFQPIETTLSCLSCLDYLAEPNPQTLICGHSICRKVSLITTHNSCLKLLFFYVFSALTNTVTPRAKSQSFYATNVKLKQRIVNSVTASSPSFQLANSMLREAFLPLCHRYQGKVDRDVLLMQNDKILSI